MRRFEQIKPDVRKVTDEEKAIKDDHEDVYFHERAERGDVKRAKRILKRAGRGNPPLPGDEIR